LFDLHFADVLDDYIVDVGFSIAVGFDKLVLLYSSDEDNIDIVVLLSLVQFSVLDFWLLS
jgi:hypothetical protein